MLVHVDREHGPNLYKAGRERGNYALAYYRPMADAWVYLLRCADGSLYAGWTNDLDKRLAAHAAGTASRYTRSRLPVALALAVPQADRSAAMREEARVKRLTRPEKLALIDASPPD